MLKAQMVEACTKRFFAKPVFIEGVMQKAMHQLTAPCDMLVNGVALRLPVDTVVALISGGSGGAEGKLMSVVEFVDESGEKYRTTKGMQFCIPSYA